MQEQCHLVTRRADQQRHVAGRRRRDRVEGVGREHLTIDDRAQAMLPVGRAPPSTSTWAASSCSTGAATRSSTVDVPSRCMIARAVAAAAAGSRARRPGPLWMIALWNGPSAAGAASRTLTLGRRRTDRRSSRCPGHHRRRRCCRVPIRGRRSCPTARHCSPSRGRLQRSRPPAGTRGSQAMVDPYDDGVAGASQVRSVVIGMFADPDVCDPPWSHTMTGRRAASTAGVHTFTDRQFSPNRSPAIST